MGVRRKSEKGERREFRIYSAVQSCCIQSLNDVLSWRAEGISNLVRCAKLLHSISFNDAVSWRAEGISNLFRCAKFCIQSLNDAVSPRHHDGRSARIAADW